MSAWQSAQALLPTKCAPGISSGTTTVVEVVEQEIKKIITQAESPEAIATANVRFDFNIFTVSHWWHGRRARQIRRRAGFRLRLTLFFDVRESEASRAANGFGRDARNDRPEACATQVALIIHRSLFFRHDCVRHSNGFENFTDDLIGQIAGGRKNHLQMAGCVNDHRAKIVVDRAVSAFKGDAGAPREFADLRFRASEKTPMRGIILIKLAIGFQHFRRIKFRVERDGKKMPVRRRVGHGFKFLRRFLKIFREPRAIIRQRTARVEKSDGKRLTRKITQADGVAEFVREFVMEQFKFFIVNSGDRICQRR
jgi:hypothetical protein